MVLEHTENKPETKAVAIRFPKTVRVVRAKVIDLECCGSFKLEKDQTYYDDGSTVFDAYIAGGLEDGSLIEARRDRNTIAVSAKNLLRS